LDSSLIYVVTGFLVFVDVFKMMKYKIWTNLTTVSQENGSKCKKRRWEVSVRRVDERRVSCTTRFGLWFHTYGMRVGER
jgi:hypothetical protein